MSDLTDLIATVRNAVIAINNLSKTLANSFVSLAANNTFTGTDTFKLPPVINAGAVGTGSFAPMGRINSQFSVAGIGNAADLTDDTLFTFALPASSLDVVGRGVIVEAFGKFAANGNNKTVKIFFGSAVVTSGVQVGNNVGWRLRLELYKQASNVQIGSGWGQAGTTVFAVPVPINGAEADTNTITIKVTGASPTTGAANDVLGMGMVTTFVD
jgi:hypothetical protein